MVIPPEIRFQIPKAKKGEERIFSQKKTFIFKAITGWNSLLILTEKN